MIRKIFISYLILSYLIFILSYLIFICGARILKPSGRSDRPSGADSEHMASAAMSTYYPMIYDFLVEQAHPHVH